jgi:hypothetical protein
LHGTAVNQARSIPPDAASNLRLPELTAALALRSLPSFEQQLTRRAWIHA